MSERTPELVAAVAERMNRLPEVAWDRCVFHDSVGVVYGWIARDDGRFDFVLLDFSWGETTGLDGKDIAWAAFGFSTSSAAHSESIQERLHGTGNEHKPCERVEDIFGALVHRSIALNEGGAPR